MPISKVTFFKESISLVLNLLYKVYYISIFCLLMFINPVLIDVPFFTPSVGNLSFLS